jgi:uncharacterized membrane protein
MKLGKNSYIGIGLITIAIVLAFIVSSLRVVEAQAQANACGMPLEECPHAKNLPPEIYAGYSISVMIGLIGVYLIMGDFRSAKIKSQSSEQFGRVASALKGDEKKLYDLVASSDGVMFQSDLVEKSGLQKVKVSRVLDRLEAQGMLERRRRGMSNVVVLKRPAR